MGALYLLVYCLAAGPGPNPATGDQARPPNADRAAVLGFVQNHGQWDESIRYLGDFGDVQVIVHETGFDVLQAPPRGDSAALPELAASAHPAAVSLRFGAGHAVAIRPGEPLVVKAHYFRGRKATVWRTDVPSFAELVVDGLYRGVDARLYSDGGRFRYDLLVGPGADPAAIEIEVEGASEVSIEADGNAVHARSPVGSLTMRDLRSFQHGGAESMSVAADFRLDDERLGFYVGSYDRSRTLVLDPVVFATYLGGGNSDFGRVVDVDPDGNVLIAGVTGSEDHPVTSGSYANSYQGGSRDAFVSRLDPQALELQVSSFLGGSNRDEIRAILALDNGEMVVAGYTDSDDFPVTPDAPDILFEGGREAFLAHLSADGSDLLFSTFLGGSGREEVNVLDRLASGLIVLAGASNSTDLPTSDAAPYPSAPGMNDGFIATYDPALRQMPFLTYLGGSADDEINGIVAGPGNSVWLTGLTESGNFPLADPSVDPPGDPASGDAFVTHLPLDGGTPVFSTRLGGSNREHGGDLALEDNTLYVVGTTSSPDFPLGAEGFDTTLGGGAEDVTDIFLSALDAVTGTYLFGTFLGGSGNESLPSLEIAPRGLVVSGQTDSADLPISSGAEQPYLAGVSDAFFSVLSRNGRWLMHSSYWGGTGLEIGAALALRPPGTVYLAGFTSSTDMGTTVGVFQPAYGMGDFDSYLVALEIAVLVAAAAEVPASAALPLVSAYPTPASNRATLSIETQVAGPIEIDLFDAFGRRLRSIARGYQPAGRRSYELSTSDLAAGTYYVRLQGGDGSAVARLTVIK